MFKNVVNKGSREIYYLTIIPRLGHYKYCGKPHSNFCFLTITLLFHLQIFVETES